MNKLLIGALLLIASLAAGQTAGERSTDAYLNSIRNNPLLLNAFLRAMPKGGDLHNHLVGAVYAEHYVAIAADNGMCIDVKALAIVAAPCDPAAGHVPATDAFKNPVLYRDLLHAFSMRDFVPAAQSGEDHFFD